MSVERCNRYAYSSEYKSERKDDKEGVKFMLAPMEVKNNCDK